ncbi:hypothetical protein D3C84_684450 [compost metagenome]
MQRIEDALVEQILSIGRRLARDIALDSIEGLRCGNTEHPTGSQPHIIDRPCGTVVQLHRVKTGLRLLCRLRGSEYPGHTASRGWWLRVSAFVWQIIKRQSARFRLFVWQIIKRQAHD